MNQLTTKRFPGSTKDFGRVIAVNKDYVVVEYFWWGVKEARIPTFEFETTPPIGKIIAMFVAWDIADETDETESVEIGSEYRSL